jgi:hypothetical protein
VGELESSLLWDHQWPGVVELVAAALAGEERALARMVQVVGLMVSAKLLGSRVIDRFHRYKKHIHPVRREECERIWKIIQNPQSS